LALAAIYDGATRTEAARIGGVGLQIIRDWVMRFNARGAAGLLDGKSPGQPSKLNDVQRLLSGGMNQTLGTLVSAQNTAGTTAGLKRMIFTTSGRPTSSSAAQTYSKLLDLFDQQDVKCPAATG
jgi:hypothetical protein